MIELTKDPALRQMVAAGLERQKAFGWTIAWAIFLGGTGGGIFLASYLLANLYQYQNPLLQTGQILGPVLATVCAACFMIDLGNKGKMPRLFGDPSRLGSSWVARGAVTLTFFIVFGLAYSLPFLPWSNTPLNAVFGLIAAVAGLVLVIYTGFLLGVVKSIPFWNNPLLPVLFIISGLGSGIAVLLVIGAVANLGQSAAAAAKVLMQGEIALIVIQLLMLWAYLGVSIHRDVASAESVRLIKLPIALIIVVGLLVPLVLLVSSLGLADIRQAAPIELAAGVLELGGALFLRFSILNAGVYLRLQAQ